MKMMSKRERAKLEKETAVKESKSSSLPGFLDHYSSSENGRIFNKADKKVSFKWTTLNGVLKL